MHQAVYTSACLPIHREALEGGITGLQKNFLFYNVYIIKILLTMI
jgi:hypothetical protein